MEYYKLTFRLDISQQEEELKKIADKYNLSYYTFTKTNKRGYTSRYHSIEGGYQVDTPNGKKQLNVKLRASIRKALNTFRMQQIEFNNAVQMGEVDMNGLPYTKCWSLAKKRVREYLRAVKAERSSQHPLSYQFVEADDLPF
jgi:hypothetical protein